MTDLITLFVPILICGLIALAAALFMELIHRANLERQIRDAALNGKPGKRPPQRPTRTVGANYSTR